MFTGIPSTRKAPTPCVANRCAVASHLAPSAIRITRPATGGIIELATSPGGPLKKLWPTWAESTPYVFIFLLTLHNKKFAPVTLRLGCWLHHVDRRFDPTQCVVVGSQRKRRHHASLDQFVPPVFPHDAHLPDSGQSRRKSGQFVRSFDLIALRSNLINSLWLLVKLCSTWRERRGIQHPVAL